MRLERASAYGLLALVHMADHQHNGTPTQVQQISDATGIPVEYLRKLMGRLSRARLIKSIRGRRGGFRLAQSVKRISVLQVVEAIEGPIDAGSVLDDDLLSSRNDPAARQLQRWRKHAAGRMRKLLSETTVGDIASNGNGRKEA